MSRFTRIVAGIAVAGLALWAPRSLAVDEDPVHAQARAITDQIICPCSCGEVLTGCTCDTGISMKGFVESSVKKGQGKDQIMGTLVAQYGEVVRGAPKAEGFNLIVWVAPFVATLAGFIVAWVVLRRWVRRPALAGGPAATAPGGSSTPSVDESYDLLRSRAEAELREMRE